ncbi:NACHT domain-containing protein [Streptomyces sp. NPDC035033]|uniref:NACHT domain-containing protein n=1 Tax=Streptomyces sp. NPDC035033 TaxID=3155368 RepID=UPI0033C5B5F9
MDESSLDLLATRLRTLRVRRGLSMTGLQLRSGLGKTTVSQALNGSRVPSEATVVALARALGVDSGPLLALRRQSCSAPAENAFDAGSGHGRLSFEDRYRRYVAEVHGRLTVVGLDLSRPDRSGWPLDAAYLSLELAHEPAAWWADDVRTEPTLVVRRAEQALAGRRRALLKGLAGSGKSTLLQWLAVAAANNTLPEELEELRGRLPFVLPLRSLVRRGRLPGPEGFVTGTAAPLAALEPAGWVDSVLSRRGLLLIDGVDEVPLEQRQSAREWLDGLLAAYPDLRVYVTTRPSAVPEGWLAHKKFTELTVRPMNAVDTSVFVERWHAAARRNADGPGERAHLDELETALRTAVRAQRDLAQLSTTPLMCALICALHRERRGHLPHGRMELYAAALSMLLVRRDHERGISLPEGILLTEQQSTRLLQRLAYWLIRNRQTEMDRDTALALLADALPAMPTVAEQGDAEQVLHHLIGRTGLLRSPAAGTVDFVHRTFQDYLGAQAAVEGRDLPLLVNNAHDDQWEDVIRMAVAHARPHEATILLTELVHRGDREENNRARLHLLAAASLHHATEVDAETRDLVGRRTGTWLPPRSPQEADVLAAVGPGVLDLLPRTAHGLESDEMSAVIRTAAEIGGDQAYELVRQIVPTLPASLHADLALADGWARFDAHAYARDVLLPRTAYPSFLGVTVQTPEQLDALSLLPPQRQVTFEGPFGDSEIRSRLSPERIAELRIYDNEALTGIRIVRDLPALRRLSLAGCRQLTRVDDLADLPLEHPHLARMPAAVRFDPLSDLPALTRLSLYTPLPWKDITGLPVHDLLTELHLGGLVQTSLHGLTRFQELRTLAVNHPLTAEEWAELAALPRLGALRIGENDLMSAPALPGVTRLDVFRGPADDLSLDLIPDRFPHLENLWLTCRDGWTPDLRPLLACSGLRRLNVHAPHATGIERFPPEIIHLRPRPRTPSNGPAER